MPKRGVQLDWSAVTSVPAGDDAIKGGEHAFETLQFLQAVYLCNLGGDVGLCHAHAGSLRLEGGAVGIALLLAVPALTDEA